MKAIIVIDLNDTTLNEWDTDTSKCWAKVIVNTPIKGGAHGIGCVYANDNVELKPLPQSKMVGKIKEVDDFMKSEIEIINEEVTAKMMLDTELLIASGYNLCIDEILGEE